MGRLWTHGLLLSASDSEVKSADGQNRDDLDYGASADQPDIDKTECGYRFLTPIQPTSDLIKAQQQADQGTDDWVFGDPRRVASVRLPGRKLRNLRSSDSKKHGRRKDDSCTSGRLPGKQRPT